MSIPIPVNSFPEGDDDTYPWASRLNKGENQYLLDLMSEWQLFRKSEILRFTVGFTYTYLPKILEESGTALSESIKTIMNFRDAGLEAERYEETKAELARRVQLIATTDHPMLKVRLEETAKEYASLKGLPWPPPELPLTDYDSEAKYIMDRILITAGSMNAARITSRDLLMNCHWTSEDIVPVLEKLEQHHYIQLEEEKRSGPTTLWINLLTMPIKKREGPPTVQKPVAQKLQEKEPFDVDKLERQIKDDGPF